jgi:arsenite methyltransferase
MAEDAKQPVNDRSPPEPIDFDEKTARRTERNYLAPEIVAQRVRTHDALAPRAGEHVLDVGCGPGLLAHDLALSVGPEGQVHGVDKSAAMIALAKARCRDLPQATFAEGIAESLDTGDASVDAVACTQVLLYVPEVATALEEMRRVLKPGGRLAIIETDWRGLVLNSSDPDLTARIAAAWDDAVPSPNLPSRLGPLLRNHGFAAIRVEAVPILNTSLSPGTFSSGTIRWIARAAEKQGVVDEEQAEAWLDDLRRLDRDGAYFFCVNRFLFSAVRM